MNKRKREGTDDSTANGKEEALQEEDSKLTEAQIAELIDRAPEVCRPL